MCADKSLLAPLVALVIVGSHGLAFAQGQSSPPSDAVLTIGTLARNQAKAMELESVAALKKSMSEAAPPPAVAAPASAPPQALPVAPPVFREPPLRGEVVAIYGRPGEMVAEVAWSDGQVQALKAGQPLRGARSGATIVGGKLKLSAADGGRLYGVGEYISLPISGKKNLRKH